MQIANSDVIQPIQIAIATDNDKIVGTAVFTVGDLRLGKKELKLTHEGRDAGVITIK